MSKCARLTYTLRKKRDGNKPQSQQEKQTTTDPPEQSDKPLVKTHINQNSKAIIQDHNSNHNDNFRKQS